ncbi:hypothetical protein Leryth_002061 [Lithospermum erythrorhizon]|nr:hypothetical protein Leryth_002061 [Lithospermum erythrorhizon]
MKIFNWMNRKFGSKDERSLKKGEFIAKETDKKPLIENVDAVDVIDVDWRDNLLTIGTLGFDQLQKFIPGNDEYFDNLFPEQNEEKFENDYDDEYPVEEFFEENNEVHATKFNSLSPVLTNLQSDLVKDDGIKSINGNTLQPINTRNENNVDDCGSLLEVKDFRDVKKKKVTLAELFSAETIEDMKGNNNEKDKEKTIMSKSTSGHSKHSLSSAKKLIPGVARVDARLAHKLNRMVTRMLKKKIHPDPASQGKHQRISRIKLAYLGINSLLAFHRQTVSLLQPEMLRSNLQIGP